MLEKPTTCKNCPLYAEPYGKPCGYVPRSGASRNGVLVILEAAGADEEMSSTPTQGKAGQYLWSQLQRIGIDRDDFCVHNILSCRPPDNKLVNMPYTSEAIRNCKPNLEATIEESRKVAESFGKTFVIVALGKFAFRGIMGITESDPVMDTDYYTYPHWSESYKAWVLAAPHPSYLMQGAHHLTPTMQFVFQRALEIAEKGFAYDAPAYILNPSPEDFSLWVDKYLTELQEDPELVLSYDIETPYKSGKDESDIVDEDEDQTDTHILRCSFCYRPGDAVSVPWTAAYMGSFERIFGSKGRVLGWNNQGFDDARVAAYVPFNVVSIDAMLAWHTLNTSLPKGLGFVTPFYWHGCQQWKHLSDSMPEFYNAKDSDAALRCWIGIKEDLKRNNLWEVFDRHVVQLNEVLRYMSSKGVLIDMKARQEAEVKLTAHLENLESRIQEVVPLAAKKLTPYKKTPKDLTGLVQVKEAVNHSTCPLCKAWPVVAGHFKSIGVKKLKAGDVENPCVGLKSVKEPHEVQLWARVEPFKLSNKAMQRYQELFGHEPIRDRKTKKVTFDVKAMKMLQKNYPLDPLYKVVGEFRQYQKLLSVYIGRTQEDGSIKGSMLPGADGRLHTSYNHNPSTLRLASARPNLQNCYTGDVELLTQNGWKRLDAIEKNVPVGQVDNNGILSFVLPSGYTREPQSDWIRFLGEENGLDLTVTANHNMVSTTRDGKLMIDTATSWLPKDGKIIDRKFIRGVRKDGIELSDEEFMELRRAICVQADGHVRTDCSAIDIAVRSARKRKQLVELFGNAVKHYDDRSRVLITKKHPAIERWLSLPSKDFKHDELIKLSSAALNRALTEIMLWDGDSTRGQSYTQLNTREASVDAVQLIAVLSGHSTKKAILSRPQYVTVSVHPKSRRFVSRLHIKEIASNQEAFCVTVPSGMLLIRSKGYVMVCGNCPRPSKNKDAPQNLIRGLIKAGEGMIFSARDFSGIEAVLVGYEARAADYIRLARRDVHSFYTAHAMYHIGDRRLTANDLPLLSWDDEKLFARLAEIKKLYKAERNDLYKHLVHAINFGQGAKGAQDKIYKETGIMYDVKLIARAMDIYKKELFPAIPRWHQNIRMQAHEQGFLRNAFGYVHRFSHVYQNKLKNGIWERVLGDDAEAVLAFKPQSTAAGIMKECLLRMYFERFEEAGQWLRMTIHDEIFCEVPRGDEERMQEILRVEMERPVKELPLPPEWGMGSHLVVLSEGKDGDVWAAME